MQRSTIAIAALSMLIAQSGLPAFAGKDFGPYMKLVQNKIHWSPPAKTTAKIATVSFTIGKTGTPSEIKMKEPSGDPAVDLLAIDTIKKAAPFPPLPAGEQSLQLTFNFPCQRGITVDGTDMGAYTADLWPLIRKTWWVPKRLLFMQVKLKFEIAKDGTLQNIAVEKSSGDKNADKLAVIAIKRIGQYKPLPGGVEGPYRLTYEFGFANDHSKDFSIWNGQRYNMGESYTTSGGSKVGHHDTTTEKDQAFNLRKEEALIKMSELDDQIDKEEKAGGPDNIKLVPLYVQYARQDRLIEEHTEALKKLKKALEIARKNTGNNEIELSQCLCALAQVEYNLGHMQEAEPLFKEAIELKEKAKSNDKEFKELLETYARMLYKQGRVKEYDEVSKRAREITG